MAMVHPSRIALVPQEPQEKSRRRSPSPRRHRDRERSRDRGRSRSRSRDRRRSPSRDRGRRASPEYDDYKRPELPPWKRPEHMYTDRRGGYGDLESRRQQRESMTYVIWPPSPKTPTRSPSPYRHRKSKKSKRSHSTSSSDSSSEEERRRRRKEKKRARHEKKEKRRRHHSEEEDGHRSRRRSKSHHVSDEEDEWVVKSSTNMPAPGSSYQSEDADDDDLGPQPAIKPTASKKVDERSYGGALLRGEGSAMAAFLKEGTEARIPRRGEIGLTSEQIAAYESVGYVMSGSRHQRMNAVRMRKENQVISAEEKRGILKLQKDERERREAILREEFSELVKERLRGTDSASSTTK